MKDLEIKKYKEEYKSVWNEFIANSKNGSFLFDRNYMEYHADRFVDFSLMFFENNKLIAVLPANIEGDMLSSHSGLTYGGIISEHNTKTSDLVEIFDKLKEYLKENGVKKLKYKTIPHIYHTIPSNEDLYALYVNNATLIKQDFSAAINLQENICQSSKKKNRNVNVASRNGVYMKRNTDFKAFWNILENLLREKYNSKPTHTVEEIELLANRFPDNIKLFSAYKDNNMIAGGVVYESNDNVVNMQYQAITEEGKQYYALDYMYHYLIDMYKSEKKYFNYGSSIIRETNLQNLDLLRYKESQGARIVRHDTYELVI